MSNTALAIRTPAARPRRMRAPLTPTAAAEGREREPIGSLDLELAPTRDEQLAYLAGALGDEREYARRFLVCAFQVGASLHVSSRGRLMIGMGADERLGERRGRMSPLVDHMALAGMQNAVVIALNRNGYYTDRRPNDPRQTTKVLRDFLNAGFRLYAFNNWIEEGGSMPLEWFTTDDQDRADEIERAGRAYLQLRARYAARFQIERAVRMLGRRHEGSGAIVLERRA